MSKLNERFSVEVTEKGFTAVPNLLFKFSKKLKLTSSEFHFICNLYHFAYDSEMIKTSFLKLSTLQSSRTHLKKILSNLQKKNLVILYEVQDASQKRLKYAFDLSSLHKKLVELQAKEDFLKEKLVKVELVSKSLLTEMSKSLLTNESKSLLTEMSKNSTKKDTVLTHSNELAITHFKTEESLQNSQESDFEIESLHECKEETESKQFLFAKTLLEKRFSRATETEIKQLKEIINLESEEFAEFLVFHERNTKAKFFAFILNCYKLNKEQLRRELFKKQEENVSCNNVLEKLTELKSNNQMLLRALEKLVKQHTETQFFKNVSFISLQNKELTLSFANQETYDFFEEHFENFESALKQCFEFQKIYFQILES